MHSSRMRTAHLLPVSPSMNCSCGVYLPGGVPARGYCMGGRSAGGLPAGSVPAHRGYLPGEYLGRYPPAGTPTGRTDRHV